MATKNKGVMIYLPKEVEEYMIKYCTEYNIVRKDKEGNMLPSLGTGVVTYLKSTISGESPDVILAKSSRLLSSGLSKDEVLDLIREYNTSESLSTGLNKDEVLGLINESSTSQILGNTPSTGLTRDEVIDLIDKCVTSHLLSAGLGEGLTKDEVIGLITSDRLSKSSSNTVRKTSEPLDLSLATEASWGSFHQALGLESNTRTKSASLGVIAVERATKDGYVGWSYKGKTQKFYRNSP